MALRSFSRVCAGTVLQRSTGLASTAAAAALFSRESARHAFATDVSATSGVPENAFDKKVTIYSPARSAGQQGRGNSLEGASHPWSLAFPTEVKWENPLMGWTSTADVHENMARAANGMTFQTKEDAISYCQKMGYDFEVREPKMRRTDRTNRFATYSDNFSTRRAGIPSGGFRSELPKAK